MREIFPRAARRALALAMAWGMLGGLFVAGAAEDVRTWSDARGKFKIQAKYVALTDGKVTLEKPDGSEIEIDLKKLSPADQKYVASVQDQEDNPFKPAAEADPFKSKGKGKDAIGSGGATGGPRVVEPDWSAARAVDPVPTNTQWAYLAGKPADSGLKLKGGRPIPIPGKANFFEAFKGMAVNARSKRAVIGYNVDEPKPAGTTRLVLCDLEAGTRLGVGAAPGKLVPLALHDDGTRVLMRRDEWGWGNSDRLEIWSLGAKGIAKSLVWTPYGDLQGGDRDVRWAEFLDAKRLATASSSGKLAVWDLESARPLYHMQMQGSCIPALSPDRKTLAFTTGKELGLLDLDAGEVTTATTLPRENLPWPALSFSATGKRLACSAFDRLYVWDAASGKLEGELPYHGLPPTNGEVHWPDDDTVLLGKHTLVDLPTQVRVWNYQGDELVQVLGGLGWFVSGDSPGAVVPIKLPHPAAKAALDKALADPGFFILKEGTVVSIDTSALADTAAREKARASLMAKLESQGCKVASGAPLVLSATTEVGPERKIQYHKFGGGIDQYKIKEHTSRVRFLYEGKVAWEASAAHVPFMLHKDLSEEEYRREYERPNYTYFDGVELPKLLTRPTPGGATLGTSQISAAGMR